MTTESTRTAELPSDAAFYARRAEFDAAAPATLSRIALTGTLHSMSATARGGQYRGRPASPHRPSNRALLRLFLLAAASGALSGVALSAALNLGLL